ncbi:MAG: hypothetical protein ACYS8W_20500 [Planctomycetota bacterium]
MKKRIELLIKQEKTLVLNGRILDAITHYATRTGSTISDTRIAIYNWLQSRESARA